MLDADPHHSGSFSSTMTALRLSRLVRFSPCEALAPTAYKIASRALANVGRDDPVEAVRKPVFRAVEEDGDRREDRPRRHVFGITLRLADVGFDADSVPLSVRRR